MPNMNRSKLEFVPKSSRWGMIIYECDSLPNFTIVQHVDTKDFWIRVLDPTTNDWKYPLWSVNGFAKLSDAVDFLEQHDLETATPLNATANTTYNLLSDLKDAMDMLGFTQSDDAYYTQSDVVYENKSIPSIVLRCVYDDGVVYMTAEGVNGVDFIEKQHTKDISRVIRFFEKYIVKYSTDGSIFSHAFMTPIEDRNQYNIEAGISTRDMMKNLVRVKSSNMWGMAMNIKDRKDRFGDVIVQFKGKNGGPDDVYQYFDVPVPLYRRWIGAPSKGHFFWQYVRDVYKYRKLTGSKKGVLPNAVN